MLYIVATPIGNIKEITLRAIETLKNADVILCEDTRHSRVLLDYYEIKKPLISYQKFNEKDRCEQVMSMLEEGREVALISDAGMPLISDPGYVIVKEAQSRGYKYTVISGPCALVNAVVLSSLDTTRFCMVGFLPEKKGEKNKLLQEFSSVKATLIFYCPPHDVDEYLAVLYENFGNRKIAVVREISKLYEQVCVGELGQQLDFMRKGEFVLVVEGAKDKSVQLNSLSEKEHIRHYLNEGMSKKDAVKAVASDRKIAKSLIYAIALEMEEE